MIMKTSDHKSLTKKIQMIEDKDDGCVLINLFLYGANTTANHVKSICHAQSYLQKKEPSFIVLENHLPDGFESDFFGYLKDNYPSVKIIMTSGSEGVARDIAHIGADSVRPFTREELQRAIDEMLN